MALGRGWTSLRLSSILRIEPLDICFCCFCRHSVPVPNWRANWPPVPPTVGRSRCYPLRCRWRTRQIRTQKQALEPMHYKCSHHECAAPPLYINIIKQKRQRLKNGQLDMCGDITRTLYILFVHSIQDGSGDLCLSLESVASWSNSVIASAKILSSFFFPQPMLLCMALNLSFIVILPLGGWVWIKVALCSSLS